MKTKDFLKKHDACTGGAKWALSIGEEMDAVWNAMVEQGKYVWLIWTATRPGVFPVSVLRKLACRFVRETPLADGRKIWDLLTDERSRKAVEVAEFYADGKATAQELEDAYAAAFAAADAADAAYTAAARAATYDATYNAACNAARVAAYAAAYAVRAAYDAVYAAARAAACAADAADAAACAADADAKAAQIKLIAELGNPFKKERAGR